MAGKRDEVFLLGEEEVGTDSWSAVAEEPSATAPAPGSWRSFHLPLSWPLIAGALGVVVALALLTRSGGHAADSVSPRTEIPAVVTTPGVTPIARVPREVERPHRVPERQPRRPRSGEPGKAMEEPEESMPAPPAETASAPVVTYAPEPETASEPASEDTVTAPAQAVPLSAPPPEFGIER